jgi:nucleoredoxin
MKKSYASSLAVGALLVMGVTLWSSCSAREKDVVPLDPENSLAKLFGDSLRDAQGRTVSVDTLRGRKIGLYFSAAWCPPCRAFTPVLAENYGKMRAAGHPFELVFVSRDENDEAMQGYIAEYNMPGLHVAFDAAQREELPKFFGIRGIPTLLILDEKGKTLTREGRRDVMQQGAAAYQNW